MLTILDELFYIFALASYALADKAFNLAIAFIKTNSNFTCKLFSDRLELSKVCYHYPYYMFPWIKVLKTSVFICELTIPANLNADKICNWLRSYNVNNLNFSEVNDKNYKFWVINFDTENESLVLQLQARCKEKVYEILEDKEKQIQELNQQFNDLQQRLGKIYLKVSDKEETIKSLGLRYERKSSNLKQLKSLYKDLHQRYLDKSAKLDSYEKELKQLRIQIVELKNKESKQKKAQFLENNNQQSFSEQIPIEACMYCGRSAMPGQGICLECSK